MSKIRLIFLFFCLCFVFIIGKLFVIQVLHRGIGIYNDYNQSQRIEPERGRIFDRNKQPLVTNQTTYLVYVEPKKTDDKHRVIEVLHDALAMDEASVEARIDDTKDWVSIRSGVTEDQKKQIQSQKVTGIGFEERSTRYYPEASLAAQLLGFVGKDKRGEDVGYFGIEGFYDKDLTGLPGLVSIVRDPLGHPVLVGNYEKFDSNNGSDLVLTIDRSIQEMAKRKLLTGMEQFQAAHGCVLIANPKSMEMLAMTCLPDYDPDRYFDFNETFFSNQATSSLFEPGSIFKPLIVAAALEEKKIKPDEEFKEGGPLKVGEYEIRTWNNKYLDKLSVTQVLERSSNVGMVKIGEKLGNDNIFKYMQKYGFGDYTGIDLQGESPGYIRPHAQWYPIDYATATFGQGLVVTPIQILRAFASIVNGGKLMQPYVVKDIQSNGSERSQSPKVVRQTISEKTSRIVREMLVSTVEHGEYRYAKPEGYAIGGKTGTAQIAVKGTYDASKTIASFIGFAPADDPQFIALVMFKEPKTAIYGSETAAPLFFEIAKELLYYYNIPPSQ